MSSLSASGYPMSQKVVKFILAHLLFLPTWARVWLLVRVWKFETWYKRRVVPRRIAWRQFWHGTRAMKTFYLADWFFRLVLKQKEWDSEDNVLFYAFARGPFFWCYYGSEWRVEGWFGVDVPWKVQSRTLFSIWPLGRERYE